MITIVSEIMDLDEMDIDEDHVRLFCQSDSTISISEISQKVRRGSFFIKWDPSLKVPKPLKKMRKDRLNLSQNDFSALEYQLYCCRILLSKKDCVYTYGARNVHLKNDVYEKLIRYLDVWQVYNMCIWRHHNLTMTMPNDDMKSMFTSPAKDMEEETERQVKRMTQITINENYKLRRAHWSVTQRLAARHTRDFFLYDFETKYPMLCDLKCTQDNHDMIREFVLALLKADVSIETIKDICDAQLYGMPEVPKMVELEEEMSKKKMEMPVQRSSITDFSPITTEVVAATKLQRAYRKRLETLKEAVRRIEEWWEPHRVDNIEIRLEIAQEMEEAMNNLEPAGDLFQYKELVAEIKDDYKTVRHPETRTINYWSKVIMILTVPVAIGILLGRWNLEDFTPLILICYGVFQYLTAYRKLWKVLWVQTLVLWLFTVILLNSEVSMIQDGWIRIPVWVVIVAVGRKRWILLFLATLVIRVGLMLFSDTFSIQPTEYGLVVYDLYCMATIAGASRQGTPIEMLHKVVINVVFLIIIGFSGVFGCLYGCMIINN